MKLIFPNKNFLGLFCTAVCCRYTATESSLVHWCSMMLWLERQKGSHSWPPLGFWGNSQRKEQQKLLQSDRWVKNEWMVQERWLFRNPIPHIEYADVLMRHSAAAAMSSTVVCSEVRVLKGDCVRRSLTLSLDYPPMSSQLNVVLGGGTWLEESGQWRHDSEGISLLGPFPGFASWLPWSKQLCPIAAFHCDVSTLELTDHGGNLLKSWIKINLLSSTLCVIRPSNGKGTNTLAVTQWEWILCYQTLVKLRL